MKRLILLVTAVITLAIGAIGMAPAYAAGPTDTVCTTLGSDAGCSTAPANSIDLNKVIATIINIMSVLIGIVAVIMIIVSGFRYITSGGDSSKTASAKNTLIYAIIGLVIVALAQVIVKFVLDRLINSPNCAAGSTLNNTTNKCVPLKKKTADNNSFYYYAVADKHYRLNYLLS
jgi:hypothetical protein